ncbi:MAG: flagellar assembly protein FliH [Burkholderiales bacterium]|nr:flagellar assembly protein FliH [Burkholderiales bacterium]
MSAIIPKANASQARTWLAPELRLGTNLAQTASSGQQEQPKISLPTAQSLETVFDQAQAQGYEAGRRQGWDEGQAAGLAAGRAQAEADVSALRNALLRLKGPTSQLDAEVEAAVVALALEIARQVVVRELHTHPEDLVDLLHSALAAFPVHAGTPWVRLHPEDVKLLHELAPELEAGGMSLIADEALHRGDLILAAGGEQQRATPERRWRPRGGHDAHSELDLRIDERWRQVMARLFEEGSL